MMSLSPYLIKLENISFDNIDFGITVAEVNKQIPYVVERIYWLRSNSVDVERGNHAHMNSHQFIISIQGDMMVTITDTSGQINNFELKNDGIGLYIPPKHWLKIQMPKHAVLLCLSSHIFKNQITVYDYDEFMGKP